MAIIDGHTNLLRKTLPVGGLCAHDVCYNSVDSKVYISDFYDNKLYVVGGSTDSIIGQVAVGTSPEQLCYVPTTNRLYCTN